MSKRQIGEVGMYRIYADERGAVTIGGGRAHFNLKEARKLAVILTDLSQHFDDPKAHPFPSVSR